MNYWGEVDYDCTIKSAWCDILVLGTYMEKARVDLTIVQHNGKMGLIQTEYGYLDDEEVGWLHDFVVACDYDELDFLRTALGVFLLVNNEGKQGVLSLTAADTDKNSQIFAEPLLAIEYEEIKYKPGTPGSFILSKSGTTLEYDLLKREMRMLL